MAVDATYVDSHTFTVIGDLTANFDPGRAILAYHTSYGAKFIYVNYSSYDAINNLTTINTIQQESEDLQSDLSSIDYSNIKPDTGGIGNVPSECLWMYRGLKKYMYIMRDNSSNKQTRIMSGLIHHHDGDKDRILLLPGNLDITWEVYPDNWYYIMLSVPSNGLIITAADLSVTLNVPTLDYLKCGYYDSTGTKRCIGFFRTTSTGNINQFYMDNNMYYSTLSSYHEYYVSSSWTAPYAHNVPFGNLRCTFNIMLGDSGTANITAYLKEMEDPDETTSCNQIIGSYSERSCNSITLFTDVNKKIYAKNSSNQWIRVACNCIHLPFGLSGVI